MMRRSTMIPALIMMASVTLACGLSIQTDPRQSEVRNVELFLQAIALGDDASAEQSLSQTARDAVQAHCPNASVTACFDQWGRPAWGKLNMVVREWGVSDGSAYASFWDSATIDIVFLSTERDGLWEIDGWRGVIPE